MTKLRKELRGINANTAKKFNPLSNTILENHKISILEFLDFSLNLIHFQSLNQTSRLNKNSLNTSKYWLEKLFIVLKDYQTNIKLKSKIWIDETFYKVKLKDTKCKGNKKLRDISKDKLCIAVGVDKFDNKIFIYEGKSKPSIDRTFKTYSPHIVEESILIHDCELTHKKLVDVFKLKEEYFKSTYLKTISNDKSNPLNKINQEICLLKNFLSNHSGFEREKIQD